MFEQALLAMASVATDPYLLFLIFATTILGVITVSYTHLTLPTTR